MLNITPAESINQGYCKLEDYDRLTKSYNRYKLDTQVAHEMEEERGIWIFGPSRVGKSMLAHNYLGKVFKKP